MAPNKSVKVLWTLFWVFALAIPALASLSAGDVTPEKLSEGSVEYVLSVFCIFEAVVIVALFGAHRKDWNEHHTQVREERKQFLDTLNGIISKCGK